MGTPKRSAYFRGLAPPVIFNFRNPLKRNPPKQKCSDAAFMNADASKVHPHGKDYVGIAQARKIEKIEALNYSTSFFEIQLAITRKKSEGIREDENILLSHHLGTSKVLSYSTADTHIMLHV
ncbi:unnamed protein product [Allacma fusca]|uniref:Uncharacterized protein n=1 Tax=Allacma fusca TaxID=39272 RepID=A0A8J2L5U1_9HEXA|nr:unnamed protein product [Allacma fusca]